MPLQIYGETGQAQRNRLCTSQWKLITNIHSPGKIYSAILWSKAQPFQLNSFASHPTHMELYGTQATVD
ncbi:protein of unknown function [Cupriavidus taiwanensis]|nr:protein of unknown function [Cupriavidus taiwanensis]